MSENLQIQLLGADDVAALRGMLDMFGTAFEDVEHYTSRQPDDAWLRDLLASTTFVAAAAFAGGRVVGGIAGYLLTKFEQARRELYIYDLAVDDAWRRRGVATRLIGVFQDVASRRGAHVLFVQADRGDDPAIALYTGLGTRADVLHFDIPARQAD
ncbi:MAG: AAC(3)-I family aminoglycoside N-acetyltransferase [Alphaproteobacteria bacterium]|nr:AAC(3)-I family aminoglycoside N-acetyltransferase [Alphaproteobacteria bacterium]